MDRRVIARAPLETALLPHGWWVGGLRFARTGWPGSTPARVAVGSGVGVDRDRKSRLNPSDEQLTARLTEVIHPATLQLVSDYPQLGLRERLLTLPVMVALVLSLIWRQFGGVSEWVRIVRTETLLWVPPLQKLGLNIGARQPVRLIEVWYHGVWYRYLTNEPDLHCLPVEYLVVIHGLTTYQFASQLEITDRRAH